MSRSGPASGSSSLQRRPAPPRIAITGLGAVTPHAGTLPESWKAIVAGQRAVRWLTREDLRWSDLPQLADWPRWCGAPAPFATIPAAEDILTRRHHPAREEPVIALARHAAREAVRQAGITAETVDPDRTGAVFGTSKGGLDSFTHQWWQRRSGVLDGGMAPAGNDWIDVWPNAPAIALAAEFGWRGPVIAPVAACATGLSAVIRGAALVRNGDCDVVLTGSSDASLHPAVLASFRRLGVMVDGKVEPQFACRPFDGDRHGFAVGEGAGAIVLERWEHATARGVPILAEWIDGLQYADPSGITVLDHNSTPLVRLIDDLLMRAGVTFADLQAVSLHGTGTRINDACEAMALQQLGGASLAQVAAFGLKGGIGHLLGAAGSVETVMSVLTLQRQLVPPTVNCDQVGDDCRLPINGQGAESRSVEHLLKLSLGFGGHLTAGLLRRVSS